MTAKAGNGARLARESHAQLFVLVPENRDRDRTVQRRVVRQIDDAHTAGAEPAANLITTQPF
jgi:hypothetical protein